MWSPCRLLRPHGWVRRRFGKLCPSRWVGHLLTRLPYPGQSWVMVLTNLICRGWELTQTSVPTSLPDRLSEFPGGPQNNPSSATRPAPSPGCKPGLGRGPTPSIPQPFRFLGSGLDVGSLRAGRPVPSRFSLSAVSTIEPYAPLTHQGEGTGLPALSSRGNRYGLLPPLRVLPSPLGSQSFAPPPPPVTTDMGTHAGVGYLGVASQTVVPENPSPKGSYSLGYQPPENPSQKGSYSLGRFPSHGGKAPLFELSQPPVTSTITGPPVTSATPLDQTPCRIHLVMPSFWTTSRPIQLGVGLPGDLQSPRNRLWAPMWVPSLTFLWFRLSLPMWDLSLGLPLWSPPMHRQFPLVYQRDLPHNSPAQMNCSIPRQSITIPYYNSYLSLSIVQISTLRRFGNL